MKTGGAETPTRCLEGPGEVGLCCSLKELRDEGEPGGRLPCEGTSREEARRAEPSGPGAASAVGALTFEHVAAHHREAAALHQVAHGHVPAHSPVDARVAGLHALQGVDGQVGAPLDHSYRIVGGTNLWTEERGGVRAAREKPRERPGSCPRRLWEEGCVCHANLLMNACVYGCPCVCILGVLVTERGSECKPRVLLQTPPPPPPSCGRYYFVS